MSTKHRIWPGPECLKSNPAADGIVWPAYELRAVGGKVHRVGRGWSIYGPPTVAEVIALAHVKARARNERWLAWLKDFGACRGGIKYARRFMSPEAAVLARAVDWPWCQWIYGAMEQISDVGWYDVWAEADLGSIIPACMLLASPEWTSLPWQTGGAS